MKRFYLLIFFIVSLTLHAQTWTNYTVANTSKKILGGFTWGIAYDKDSSVWFANSDGVSRFYKNSWKNYSTLDGLANNTVYAIAVDKLGVKWVSTIEGVSSFNGTKWTNYSKNDTLLMPGTVTRITVDKYNNKWFASYNGITKFDGNKWTKYDQMGYNDGIATDKLGNVWFGNRINGILKFDGNNWIKYDQTNSGLLSNEVNGVSTDSSNNVYISTRYGASKFDGANWTTIKRHAFAGDDVFNNTVFGKNGKIFFVHYDSVSLYEERNLINLELPEKLFLNPASIASDIDGNIWFPQFSGVYKFDGVTWTLYRPGSRLSSNYVGALGCDEKNEIWCGTGLNDICKFDGKEWTTYNSDSGLKGENFKSMAFENNGVKWFGAGGSLSKFDGKKWTNFTKDDGLTNAYILSIAIDNANVKWLGYRSYGLDTFDDKSFRSYFNTGTGPYTKNLITARIIESIAVDSRNNIWVGSESGLAKYNGSAWSTSYKYENENLYILCIAIDNAGNIWCGTTKGVFKHDGLEWTDYSKKDTSIIGQVNAIKIDESGKIWCGYYQKGIKMFNGSEWKSYTTKDGLLQNDIGAVVIDKNGDKWFGTWTGGLSRFSDGGAGPLDIQRKTQKGLVFHDLNGNGKKEKDESAITGQIIKFDSLFTTTQNNGIFYTNPSNGIHTFSYRSQVNWKLTTDSLVTINITDSQIKDTIYFGVQPVSNLHKVQTQITGTRTRAGFQSDIWINYLNSGTYSESGTVNFTMDKDISLIYAFPPADSIIGKRIVWKFTNLIPNEQGRIKIITQMPGVNSLGKTLISFSEIKSNSLKVNDTIRQMLRGSYDPNDKLVAQGIGTPGYVLFGQELEYTVRFQNSGTDTAFNVNIRDTIDKNLDITSLNILASSHSVFFDIHGKNEVIFHFNNILLPHQKADDYGSNGFVKYSLKPNMNLTENTQVNNKANIFFDFNPAISTNQTINTYVSTLPFVITSLKEPLSLLATRVFPNPAKDEFTIEFSQLGTYKVKVSNIQGQIVKTWDALCSKESSLSISGVDAGIYVYSVEEINGLKFQGKIIINK